jgi:hypothetical protein
MKKAMTGMMLGFIAMGGSVPRGRRRSTGVSERGE